MCILASREHTCIDPIISKGPKKNEECKNKLDVSRNTYISFSIANKISYYSIQLYQTTSPNICFRVPVVTIKINPVLLITIP